jgi:hypothetical protein
MMKASMINDNDLHTLSAPIQPTEQSTCPGYLTAVQAIWETVSDADPADNSLTFALSLLRNEIQGTELLPQLSPQSALQALHLLRAAYPNKGDVFNRYLIYAWCYQDNDWAESGYRLLDIFAETHTFLGRSRDCSRQIGAELYERGYGAMYTIYEAIKLGLGQDAARELAAAWWDIGDDEDLPTAKGGN